MRPSKRSHVLALLAILCMGVALSAARLRLPAFTQSAAPAHVQIAPVVGGDNSSGDAVNGDRSVSLQTDKASYSPGEVIIVSGSGWDPGEAVTLQLHESPAAHTDRTVTAIADASGNIFDNQLIQAAPERGVMLQVTARGRNSGLTTQVALGNPSANLDQWANLPPISATNWVNGNLGSSKAEYFEGDSIPYRLRFGSLSLASHTVTIQWDTTKSSKHALDYITTFNRTPALAGGSLPDPCLGVSGCDSTVFSAFLIPDDPQVTGAGVTPVTDSVPTTDSKKFRLYGGTITNVSAYSYVPTTGGFAGDTSAGLTITFTASVANPVLAWGGHIATRLDWGANSSAVAIPGSPYHTRLLDLDGSGGNQDRSLSAAAVIFPGSITITKDAIPNSSTSFPFTASPSPLTNFSLVDDGTSANTIVFSNILTFQDYTVTEGGGATTPTPIPAGWNFDHISCSATSANGGSTSVSGTTVTITLKEGENWTCTYTDLQQTATPTNTPTPTNTFTATPTNTFTPTPTNTFTATPTNTFTPTPTPTPTQPCLNTNPSQSIVANDTAVIAGGNPGGTITFSLYQPIDASTPSDCKATPFHTETVNWTADGPYSTTNCLQGHPCDLATADGQWNWQVSYHDAFNTVTGTCGHENFVITTTNDNHCPTPVPTTGVRSRPALR